MFALVIMFVIAEKYFLQIQRNDDKMLFGNYHNSRKLQKHTLWKQPSVTEINMSGNGKTSDLLVIVSFLSPYPQQMLLQKGNQKKILHKRH